MYNERTFDPNFLSEIGPDKNINIPVSFIQDLTQAASLQDVLNVMANWIFYLFSAERASITIKENDTSLKLYSVMGSNAIPMESLVPIKGTMVGRVFSTRHSAPDLGINLPIALTQYLQNDLLVSC